MEAWTGIVAKWNQEVKEDQEQDWNERAEKIQILLEETEHYGQNSAEDLTEEPKQHFSFAALVDQAFPHEYYYDEEEEEGSEESAVTFDEHVEYVAIQDKKPQYKPEAPRDFKATLLAVVSSITKIGKRDRQAKREKSHSGRD